MNRFLVFITVILLAVTIDQAISLRNISDLNRIYESTVNEYYSRIREDEKRLEQCKKGN